ncbi:MAG: hypothetical protein PVH12_02405 [Candidatus Bathyarchaeota archaeon]|jgi:hypothetical protein
MVTKEDVKNLIDFLNTDIELHKDEAYNQREKEVIKVIDEWTCEFYEDLKADNYIEMNIPEEHRIKEKQIAKFSKIATNISNKLIGKSEFESEEQWFIFLSIYCWWCEAIKSQLEDVAIKIYEGIRGNNWNGFMTLGKAMGIIREYKNGKYIDLFSNIDVYLRNSFVHCDIDFPNNEVIYYDNRKRKQIMPLKELFCRFRKLPPLCVYLFAYRLRPFREEIREFATEKGFL